MLMAVVSFTSPTPSLMTRMLRVTAGQTLFGGDAALTSEARSMIERVGPVESASSVATVDATVRRTDYIDEGRTGGIAVTAAETPAAGGA